MTLEELKKELPSVAAVHVALGSIMPSRVDPELTEFLERAAQGGVEIEVLLAALKSSLRQRSLKAI